MMMTSFGSVVYGQMPETPPSDLPERDQEYQDCMADCEILSPESNVCSCKCA